MKPFLAESRLPDGKTGRCNEVVRVAHNCWSWFGESYTPAILGNGVEGCGPYSSSSEGSSFISRNTRAPASAMGLGSDWAAYPKTAMPAEAPA